MSCNDPMNAWYSKDVNPETGKRSLVFSGSNRYQGNDPKFSDPLQIPCGKCLGCKADQALVWSIRAYHESCLHRESSFITLTYDEEHMPHDGKISKRELQLFFKNLRRDLPPKSIRYIACGEYGGQTRRPHYHAIIFGKDWLEGAIPLKTDLYTHKHLESKWGKGIVSIAPVTMASICYVCGYVNKKIDDPDTFRLESRRPGIGHDWLDRYGDDLVRTGRVAIEGREYQIPKRYLQWNESEFADIRKAREEFAKKKVLTSTAKSRYFEGRARELNVQSRNKRKQEKL